MLKIQRRFKVNFIESVWGRESALEKGFYPKTLEENLNGYNPSDLLKYYKYLETSFLAPKKGRVCLCYNWTKENGCCGMGYSHWEYFHRVGIQTMKMDKDFSYIKNRKWTKQGLTKAGC